MGERMYTAAVIDLARRKTRAQFVAALPNPFLVLSSDHAALSPLQFRTVVAAPNEPREPAAPSSAPSSGPPSVEILEVCKSPGNPYLDRISVGRARNCDVVLRDASVSKLHGHFRTAPGKLELVDSGSHNGTRVNGHSIAPNTPTAVLFGDTLVFGRISAKLLDAGGIYDMLRLLGTLSSTQASLKP
jgi:hypothetical protein